MVAIDFTILVFYEGLEAHLGRYIAGLRLVRPSKGFNYDELCTFVEFGSVIGTISITGDEFNIVEAMFEALRCALNFRESRAS